ncbi:hypothetical protein AB0J86_28920 [Micromonospora sp. NPDC049559]|uniref:hypothetical protein n=1 Tax=Micromonospora sp. NPDC049559 TaxID=3155923 RepID=UPI00341DDF85
MSGTQDRLPLGPPGPSGVRVGPGIPTAGEIVQVSRAASVQFVDAFWFRVIRAHDWSTYEGWVWLDGYVLDGRGDAVERRTIWVQYAGLRRVRPRASTPRQPVRTNRSPIRR